MLLGLGGLLLLPPGALAQIQPQADAALPFPVKVATGAELRALKAEVYDPAYVKLAYPGGRCGRTTGACAPTR